MTRFAPLAILIALTATAHAQSQAELAAKANDEGKQLMYEDKYAEAAKKFQEAVARVPEAKYFVNLCTARLQEGQLGEALTACNAVELNGPTDDQKARAAKLISKINDEAKAQHLDLHAAATDGGATGGTSGTTGSTGTTGTTGSQTSGTTGTTGGTTTTVSNNQPPPTVGRPLTENLVAAGPPDNRYTWTLGFDLFGGGGRIGQPDAYGSTAGGFRIKADYLLIPEQRVGGQLYLQATHMSAGHNDQFSAETLDIVDFGVAGYKDWCPGGTPRFCFTPLIGVHASLMSPANETDDTGSQLFNYAAIGARAELSMSIAFGRRYEHVISIQGGVNIYSPVLSDSGDFTAMEVGLDTAGATGYFGLGYTYRFNTPLGRAPFIILE